MSGSISDNLALNLGLCFSSPTLECIELSRYFWNVWPVLFLKCFYFHNPRRGLLIEFIILQMAPSFWLLCDTLETGIPFTFFFLLWFQTFHFHMLFLFCSHQRINVIMGVPFGFFKFRDTKFPRSRKTGLEYTPVFCSSAPSLCLICLKWDIRINCVDFILTLFFKTVNFLTSLLLLLGLCQTYWNC